MQLPDGKDDFMTTVPVGSVARLDLTVVMYAMILRHLAVVLTIRAWFQKRCQQRESAT